MRAAEVASRRCKWSVCPPQGATAHASAWRNNNNNKNLTKSQRGDGSCCHRHQWITPVNSTADPESAPNTDTVVLVSSAKPQLTYTCQNTITYFDVAVHLYFETKNVSVPKRKNQSKCQKAQNSDSGLRFLKPKNPTWQPGIWKQW